MSARANILTGKNEQVITFTLVELLTQMVFVAMLLAIVLQNEVLQDVNPSAERLRRLEAEVSERDKRILDLTNANARLNEQLRQQQEMVRSLLGTKGTTLPFGVVAISQEEADYYASLKKSLEAQQKDAASVRRELAALKGGKGGSDRPNCTVTSGFLLDVALLSDGSFQPSPAWDKGAKVEAIDGLQGLAGSAALSSAKLHALASRVERWGLDQETPCVFRVIARRRHGSADLYDRQLKILEQHFYVARR